jgi:hypothetical protein
MRHALKHSRACFGRQAGSVQHYLLLIEKSLPISLLLLLLLLLLLQKLPHAFPMDVLQALADMQLEPPRDSRSIAATVTAVKERGTQLLMAADTSKGAGHV